MSPADPATPAGLIPRAAVSACLFRDEHVLLVKRAKPPFAGDWSLPGGSVEPGETVEAAIKREIFEEAGLTCALAGIAGVNDVIVRDNAGAVTHHYVIVVFAGRIGSGVPVAGSDAAEARLFHVGALSDLGLGRRTMSFITRARSMV